MNQLRPLHLKQRPPASPCKLKQRRAAVNLDQHLSSLVQQHRAPSGTPLLWRSAWIHTDSIKIQLGFLVLIQRFVSHHIGTSHIWRDKAKSFNIPENPSASTIKSSEETRVCQMGNKRVKSVVKTVLPYLNQSELGIEKRTAYRSNLNSLTVYISAKHPGNRGTVYY